MDPFAESFSDTLSFIHAYKDLLDSHSVNFITENVWERSLPKDLRLELEKFEDSTFPHILDNSPKLKSLIDLTKSLNLQNNPSVSKLEDLSIECTNELIDPKQAFMKVKKKYEIEVFSRVVECLSKSLNNCLIIDAGGGKGYLGTVLSEKSSIPVLSIDSSPEKSKSAIDRQRSMGKITNQTFSLAKHCVEFIDQGTNYSKLVKMQFPDWGGQSYVLTGLHTCGNLGHNLLRSFVSCDELKILCVVSCCYHLADEVLSERLRLTRNMRMMAQQSVQKIADKKYQEHEIVFWRSLLQVLLVARGISDARVGRTAPTNNFQDYVKWAFTKIGLPPHEIPPDDELTELLNKYSIHRWKMNIYLNLRAHMGTVVESSIILDRCIYLQNSKKCSKVSIVRVFDPALSPRCYAIIASK